MHQRGLISGHSIEAVYSIDDNLYLVELDNERYILFSPDSDDPLLKDPVKANLTEDYKVEVNNTTQIHSERFNSQLEANLEEMLDEIEPITEQDLCTALQTPTTDNFYPFSEDPRKYDKNQCIIAVFDKTLAQALADHGLNNGTNKSSQFEFVEKTDDSITIRLRDSDRTYRLVKEDPEPYKLLKKGYSTLTEVKENVKKIFGYLNIFSEEFVQSKKTQSLETAFTKPIELLYTPKQETTYQEEQTQEEPLGRDLFEDDEWLEMAARAAQYDTQEEQTQEQPSKKIFCFRNVRKRSFEWHLLGEFRSKYHGKQDQEDFFIGNVPEGTHDYNALSKLEAKYSD